ncbi:methylmalonyl-CoA mutase subunit beta [Tenacibaculum sp. UWU-22]|uniref:methylmalonyl-CoA mutase subunit beta n=1 Tax=Tenacibaculum sp. UWU-22 TaxID=3234187 RepID=UPI0034DB68FE
MYLFEEFDAVSPKHWKQKIQADLNGADYHKTLVTSTNEGIDINPFYTKENRTNITVNSTNKPFNICQSIFIDDEKIANTLAINALKNGANAIEFIAKKPFKFEILLKQINTQSTTLYFTFQFLNADFSIELSKFISSKNCFLNIDIIGNLAKTGNWFTNLKEDHIELEKIITSTNNSVSVNANLYQNAGANITQQLAYALAHANEYLNHFKSSVAHKIYFNFSVGSNYFFEIAKLRAFRVLWSSLLNQYNIEATAHIFAQPSLRNKTLYDYNVNMLRTTTECMSAVLGGANTISNLSYDTIFHKSSDFGERIARNQLLILQEETDFKNAQYIVDGTYYIESITQQLAEKALTIFKSIENGGGFLKQLKSGIIQKKITETASKEQNQFDNQELILVGTNLTKNETDKMKDELELYPFVKTRNQKTLIQPIIEQRLAEKTEQERLQNE